MNRSKMLGFALSLFCLAQAHAQATGAAPHAMQQATQEGIAYVSGGIGMEEREALQAAAKDYNLKLVFAEKGSGAYLADVKVVIADGRGVKRLDAESEGPWFLAKLPPGRYKVTAETGGRRLVQSATIGNKGRAELHFYWPAP